MNRLAWTPTSSFLRRAFSTLLLIWSIVGLPFSICSADPLSAANIGWAGAPKGGTFRQRWGTEPYSLNPIISDGYQTVEIQFYVIEALLLKNEDTYEWQPWLADTYKVSPDGKSYEFHIRENAKWSDGKPVTAEDVKFSYDVIFDDHFPTAHMRPYYEGIKKVEILDSHRVRFVTSEPYFGNFISSAGLPIVPKHIYGDPAVGPNIHKTIIGSGPYAMESWNAGRSITLKRNPSWWGWKDPVYQGKFNPERMVFQFVGDENVAFEMLKKGEIDYMTLTADQYRRAQQLEGPTSRFETARVQNQYPSAVSGIGFNMTKPLFKDRRVRLALAHLVDREMMAQKFFYGFVDLATGPWYRQSPFAADPKDVPTPRYDPKEALRLLREAGWEDRDHDGVLEREINGERVPLRFTIITSNKQTERFLTVFKEDAEQVGVKVDIKFLNGSAYSQVLNEGNFDAFDSSGGGGLVEFDPKPGWHSESLPRGGYNFIHYHNPEIDSLITQARRVYSMSARVPLMQEIFKKIANDVPMVFLFNDRDAFYAVSRRVGRPRPTLNYDLGQKFWWIKKGAA